jgi:nitrate/nitrite transporter NarK
MLIIPIGFLTRMESPRAAIALMSLAGLGITSMVANYTACQQDFSFRTVGLVAGILGLSSNVSSALASPLIGRYIDRTGSYQLIFILVSALPAVSLAAILIFDWLLAKRARPERGAGAS